MGKGKRQRALRRAITTRQPRLSQKAVQLTEAIDKLENLKVNALTGEIIWPEEEPIPSIHYEDQSTKERND